MALGSIVFGGSRQWRWLRALMGSAATVRMAAFLLLALAMPVANAAPCSFTWNVTNDGRTGRYAHTFSAGESAACLMGDSAYTSPMGDIADMPAEGGGLKGVVWLPPDDILYYTPPSPGFTGTNNVLWYNWAGEPITVTINMTGGTPAPTVTAVSPSSGPTSGANSVTLTGTNLSGATAVRFGAAAATILDNTATSITARVPSNSPGTVQVTVTTPGGTSATGSGNQYTYIAPPTIISVAPASGPTAGGTSVTINGTGFTGTMAVWFGATHASAVIVNSDTSITATSPAGSPGIVDVMVTAPGGNSGISASDQFTYTAPAPAVSSVSPGSGPVVGGTSVTINGSNFLGATAVRFGATNAASFSVNSANTITATSPAGSPGTVDITVTNSGGTSATSASDQFTYLSAPDVSGVAPNSGPSAGGTTVTIMGTGFIGATSVSFGGTSASSFTVNSATSITATSPARAAGTVDVRVATSGGVSASSAADQFTYTNPPVANPASLTVPYQSSNNPVTLSLSGGAATSVAVATQAAHGTATAVGTTITFTPNASFAGTDSFSYTATNASGTSAPATVSITVVNPTITYSPTAAPLGNAGQAYSHSLAGASGGAAPYTYTLLSGSLPAGMSLASNGTLSGTPTDAGVFSFRVRAQDSTTGDGPFHADSALLAIVISPPTLAMTPAIGSAFTGNVGTAFSQSFTVSGGVAPYQYTLAITSGTMPTGLSFNSATGTLSGTPTSAGSVAFQITGSDSTGGNGSMPVWQTYTLTVAAPTLGLSPATLPNAIQGTAYNQTLSTSGGSSPYSYAVTTGSLPSGLTLSLAGGLTGTPSAPGSFTFTITSTDSHGFTTSRGYNVVTNPAAPIAGPIGKIVPWNTATAIDLATAISGGAASSVAVTTTPAHGSVTISGTVATYTPAPGYTGGDSFGYSATNVSGSSASLVTLMITPQVPVAGAKSVTVNFNTATPIDLASVISGGTPTGLGVSTQPAHGAVSVSGTTITYTPSAGYSGTDSFSYTATNAGGTSAAAAVSLTINPQLPVAGAKSVTVAFDAATQIDLASVINGGTPTSLAVSTQPAHGAVSVSGTTITYTPSAGYSGTDSFSYTATNAGGTSAAAVVSLTINPQVPVANNVATTFTTGGSNRFTIAFDISGGTATGVTIVTQPAHGTVTVNAPAASAISGGMQPAAVSTAGFSATYVPDSGYVGTDSFTYTAINAGGSSAPATVSMQLNPPAPTVAPLSVTTVSGSPITIDVAARASGGPFTALVIDSQPTEGKTVLQGLGIVYTPTPAFVGTATIAYSLSNAYGTTQGTVTVTVNARLDPSRDAEVNGLVAAQADAARRFATTQLGNFNRRLERLHGNGWAGSTSSLDVSAYGVGVTLTPTGVQPNGLRNTRSDDDTAQRPVVANETDRAAVPRPARDAAASDARQKPLGFWVDGRIDLGQRDATTNQSDFDFRTDGISLGADYRLNDLASLGVGAGYARDESDIGNSGSRSTGTAGMVAIYGSLRPAQKWFVDGVLGYGALDFDLDRYVTDTGDLAQGSRQGDQVFGSLATGYERREDTWMVSPYGRLDAMTTRLDTYTESATGVSALHYNEQTVRMTTGTLGVRGEMLFNTRLGNVVPRGRFEYRRHFEGADNASVFYADLVGVGPGYLVSPAQMEKNQFVIGLGGTLILRGNVALSLDFDSTLNNDTGYSQSIGARVDMPF